MLSTRTRIKKENDGDRFKVEEGAGSTTQSNSTNNGIKAKICLVGERQVGKSALVQRYVLDQFSDEYFATLGMKVYKKLEYVSPPRESEAIPVTLMVWDIMGDSHYGESMKEIYLHGATGVIAVADVTNASSVPPLGHWVNPALEMLGDIPVQIVLNKWDAGEDEYAKTMGLKVAKSKLSPCYLTSACRGDNVERAFSELAQRIVAQKLAEKRPMSEDRMLEVLVDSIGETKTLQQLSTEFNLPPAFAEPRIRSLVRSGHMILEDVTVGPDGLPIMEFTATGKLMDRL